MSNPNQVFAKGRHAVGICMRSGLKMKLSDMVYDGYYPWMRVHPDWKEERHPQERLRPRPDPVALKRPSPETLPAPSAPVLSASEVLYEEDFNRADGPLSSPYIASDFAIPSILSNQAANNSSSSTIKTALLPVSDIDFKSPFTDGTIGMTLKLLGDGSSASFFYIYFRSDEDKSNCYRVFFGMNGTVSIIRILDGVQSGAGIVTGLTFNVDDEVEVVVEGSSIIVKQNDSVILSGTNSDVASGEYVGFSMATPGSPDTVAIDDFFVKAGQADLSWSESVSHASMIESYEVYRKAGAGSYSLIDTVEIERSILSEVLTALEYSDDSIDPTDDDYSYYLVAVPMQGPKSQASNVVVV